MGLRDYVISTKVIEGPGGSFPVRGLSGEDLIRLMGSLGDDMAEAFQEVVALKARAEEVTAEGVQGVVVDIAKRLLPKFPNLVAQIICVACDEETPEALAIARKLDAFTQLEALLGIFEETFKSEAQLKKLVETILQTMTRLTQTLNGMNVSISEAGFGEFAAKSPSAGSMATPMQ